MLSATLTVHSDAGLVEMWGPFETLTGALCTATLIPYTRRTFVTSHDCRSTLFKCLVRRAVVLDIKPGFSLVLLTCFFNSIHSSVALIYFLSSP